MPLFGFRHNYTKCAECHLHTMTHTCQILRAKTDPGGKCTLTRAVDEDDAAKVFDKLMGKKHGWS